MYPTSLLLVEEEVIQTEAEDNHINSKISMITFSQEVGQIVMGKEAEINNNSIEIFREMSPSGNVNNIKASLLKTSKGKGVSTGLITKQIGLSSKTNIKGTPGQPMLCQGKDKEITSLNKENNSIKEVIFHPLLLVVLWEEEEEVWIGEEAVGEAVKCLKHKSSLDNSKILRLSQKVEKNLSGKSQVHLKKDTYSQYKSQILTIRQHHNHNLLNL